MTLDHDRRLLFALRKSRTGFLRQVKRMTGLQTYEAKADARKVIERAVLDTVETFERLKS